MPTVKNLTQAEIAPLREKLLTKQKGICPLCKRTVKDPNLDHDHKTGGIRATLCRNCNRVEGKVSHWVNTMGIDRVQALRWIAMYWAKFDDKTPKIIHPTHGKPKKRKKRRKTKLTKKD